MPEIVTAQRLGGWKDLSTPDPGLTVGGLEGYWLLASLGAVLFVGPVQMTCSRLRPILWSDWVIGLCILFACLVTSLTQHLNDLPPTLPPLLRLLERPRRGSAGSVRGEAGLYSPISWIGQVCCRASLDEFFLGQIFPGRNMDSILSHTKVLPQVTKTS